MWGAAPSEEIRAVRAEFALQRVEKARERLELILSRFHDSGDMWAFAAIFHTWVGNKTQAQNAFDEAVRVPIMDNTLLQELLDIRGVSQQEWEQRTSGWKITELVWEEQLKRCLKSPGARLVPSRHRSSHWFGGEEFEMPRCKGCGHPIRQWFLIDIREIPPLREKLPGWAQFPLLGCMDCMVWMGRHD
jgi:hypothetical protein